MIKIGDVVKTKNSNGSLIDRTFLVVGIEDDGKRILLSDHLHPVLGMREGYFGVGIEDCRKVGQVVNPVIMARLQFTSAWRAFRRNRRKSRNT